MLLVLSVIFFAAACSGNPRKTDDPAHTIPTKTELPAITETPTEAPTPTPTPTEAPTPTPTPSSAPKPTVTTKPKETTKLKYVSDDRVQYLLTLKNKSSGYGWSNAASKQKSYYSKYGAFLNASPDMDVWGRRGDGAPEGKQQAASGLRRPVDRYFATDFSFLGFPVALCH